MLGRSDSSGWVGFGIADQNNPKMIGSEVVIGWVDVTESVHSYLLKGKSPELVVLNDDNIPLKDTSACILSIDSESWTGVHFVRSIKDGDNPIFLDKSKTTAVVVAIGSTTSLSYHDRRGITHINFIEGDYESSSDEKVLAHGIIMFITWGVILQFGVLFARYAKKPNNSLWFNVHRINQIAGYIISLSALILAFVMAKGSHFNTKVHGQLGLTIMIMGVIQILLALIRPHKDKDHPKTLVRSIWEFVHWWFGRLTLIFALINILLGLNEYNAKDVITILYLVYLGAIVLVYAILELRRKLIIDKEEVKNSYNLASK